MKRAGKAKESPIVAIDPEYKLEMDFVIRKAQEIAEVLGHDSVFVFMSKKKQHRELKPRRKV